MLEQHRRLLDAVIARDNVAAHEAMRAHLEAVSEECPPRPADTFYYARNSLIAV